jgi:hypothetical protein
MESVLAQPRHGAELNAPRQSTRGIASALAILHHLLERLIGPPRDIPPEFFLYPLP